MNKLYNKSELAFSIILIVVYIVGASLCDYFSSIIKINKVLTLPFMLALSLLLFFWIKKNNLQKKYGLCKPCFGATRFLFYIPLLILISTNLWFGVALNYGWLESLLGVFTMLCVGFVEEIIFRGFLFKSLEKNNVKSAVAISSITFGIGHLINLFSSGFENLLPSICQVFYAIAVGFLFVIMFYKGKSLIACILTHSLTNALSIFQNIQVITPLAEILVSVAIIIIAVIYAIILLKTLNSSNKPIEVEDKSNKT